MKAQSAIVLVVLVISCGATEDSSQKEKRYFEDLENNQHGYQPELHRSEYRQQPYRFHQQQFESEPQQHKFMNNEEDYHRYNQFQQNVWESQRVHNGYKHLNQYDNHQSKHVPEPHREQMRQIIYQAVPYPVEVPRHVQRPQNHGKEDSTSAFEIQRSIPRHVQRPQNHGNADSISTFEIQRSIPIYAEKQIHYQMNHAAAKELVAEKPIYRGAKEENRIPKPVAVHGERSYPMFMQYPILIVKNEQQKPTAWH